MRLATNEHSSVAKSPSSKTASPFIYLERPVHCKNPAFQTKIYLLGKVRQLKLPSKISYLVTSVYLLFKSCSPCLFLTFAPTVKKTVSTCPFAPIYLFLQWLPWLPLRSAFRQSRLREPRINKAVTKPYAVPCCRHRAAAWRIGEKEGSRYIGKAFIMRFCS